MSAVDNASIKMAVIDNKGRALISVRPLKAGEIVLRDSPILLYPDAALGAAATSAAKYCSHCFRTVPPHSPTAVSCPNCSASSLFCTPRCLSHALSTSHTPFVCQALIRLATADSPLLSHDHSRHVLARFLVSAYNLAITSPSDFQTLLSLQGEPSVNEASTFLHSLISSVVCVSPNLTQLGFSVELTSALLAKDEMNSFGLMEPFSSDNIERSVRAFGIYPRASFFNHDCLPNACRFDYVDLLNDSGNNTDVVFRVLHDVPAGREICISYFPVNFNYSERQKRLKEDYGFTCDCDRCKVEANWSDNDEDEMEGDDDNDDDDMDEDEMEAEDDNGLEHEAVQENGDDFPHAYFFLRYMCGGENCGGTLAPLPPSDARASNIMSAIMECNVCGNLSKCEE